MTAVPAFVTAPSAAPAAPADPPGSVDAGDAELVGWHTGPSAGLVPIPRLPAPAETFASLDDVGTANRALTVLPRPRKRLFSRH